ncbi:MAG: 4Fe-4S dicluster domain-containing protein [Pseudomonadota bacterium]
MKGNKEEYKTCGIRDLFPALLQDRREFIRTAALGAAAFGLLRLSPIAEAADTPLRRVRYGMILVDFNRCTGCRTCEAICAQHNHKVSVNGRELPGLGNPALARIRVYPFNPDVDVPIVCVMCGDAPCIAACPVEPDAQGRRALFRDPKTLAIRNDPERCLACGACGEACRDERVGTIRSNRETDRPEGMCTLCDGDPQCVKHCPYDALSYVLGGLDGRHYGIPAEKIAEGLMRRWYGCDTKSQVEKPRGKPK